MIPKATPEEERQVIEMVNEIFDQEEPRKLTREEKFVGGLVVRAESERKIVILKIDRRSSHGYYNYRTWAVAVYIPRYEEVQKIEKIEVKEIRCQEYDCYLLKIELQDAGFKVITRC